MAAVAPVPDNGDARPWVADGTVLAQRYRVLHPTVSGLLAYDERLSRPVLLEPIAVDVTTTVAERVRMAAASGVPVLDAIIQPDGAFVVRPAHAAPDLRAQQHISTAPNLRVVG